MAGYPGRDASHRPETSPMSLRREPATSAQLDMSPAGLVARTPAPTRTTDSGGSPGVSDPFLVEQPNAVQQIAAATVLSRLSPEMQHLHDQVRAQEEALRHLQDWIEAESRERVRNVVDVTEGLRSVSDFLGLDSEGLTSAAEAARDREIHSRKLRRHARRESRQRVARQDVWAAQREAAEVAALREGMETWEARTAQQLMVLDLELRAEVSRRYAADSQLARRRGRAGKEEHGQPSLESSTQAPSSETSGTLLSGSLDNPRSEQDFFNECLKDLTMALVQERGDREMANEDLQAQLATCQKDIATERQERLREDAALQLIAQGAVDEVRDMRAAVEGLQRDLGVQASVSSSVQRSRMQCAEMASEASAASPSYHLSPQALLFEDGSSVRSSPPLEASSAPRRELQAGLDGLEAWARRELESQALAHSAACSRLERRFDELQRHFSDEERARSRESWQRVVDAATAQPLSCDCPPPVPVQELEDETVCSPGHPLHGSCWREQLECEISKQAERMAAIEQELQGVRQGLAEEVQLRHDEDAEVVARLKLLEQEQDEFKSHHAEDMDSVAELAAKFTELYADQNALQNCLRELKEQMAPESFKQLMQAHSPSDGLETLHAALAQERSDREAAHAELTMLMAALQRDLSTEKDERVHTRAALPQIRQSLGEQFEQRLRSIKWELDAEVQERTVAVENLQSRCADLHSHFAKEVADLQHQATGSQQEVQTSLSAGLQKEQCEREIADSALKAQLASLRQDMASQKEEQALAHVAMQRSVQNMGEQTTEQVKVLTDLLNARDVEKVMESHLLELCERLEAEQTDRRASADIAMKQIQDASRKHEGQHRSLNDRLNSLAKAHEEHRLETQKQVEDQHGCLSKLSKAHEEHRLETQKQVVEKHSALDDRLSKLAKAHEEHLLGMQKQVEDQRFLLDDHLNKLSEAHQEHVCATQKQVDDQHGLLHDRLERLAESHADHVLGTQKRVEDQHSSLDDRMKQLVKAHEEHFLGTQKEAEDQRCMLDSSLNKVAKAHEEHVLRVDNQHGWLHERLNRLTAAHDDHVLGTQKQVGEKHRALDDHLSNLAKAHEEHILGMQKQVEEMLSEKTADRLRALEDSHNSFREESLRAFRENRPAEKFADRLPALERDFNLFREATHSRLGTFEEEAMQKLSDQTAGQLLALQEGLHSFREERLADNTSDRLLALEKGVTLSGAINARLLALEDGLRSCQEMRTSDRTAERLLAMEQAIQSVREANLSDKTADRLIALQEALHGFREERLSEKTAERLLALEDGLQSVREAHNSRRIEDRMLALEDAAKMSGKLADLLDSSERGMTPLRKEKHSRKVVERSIGEEDMSSTGKAPLSEEAARRMLALGDFLQNEVVSDDSSEADDPSIADSHASLASSIREVESPLSDALRSRRDLLQSTRKRLSSEVASFSETDVLERKLSGQVLKDVAVVLEFLLCGNEEAEDRIQSLLTSVRKEFEASLEQVRLDSFAAQIKAEGEKRDALEQKVDHHLTARVCEAEVSKLAKRVEELELQSQAFQSWMDQLQGVVNQEISSRRDHGKQLHARLDEVQNKVEQQAGVDPKVMTALSEQVASLSEAVILEQKERSSGMNQVQALISQCSQSLEAKLEANRSLEKDCASQLQTLSAAVDVSDLDFREKLAICQQDLEQEQLQRRQELKSLHGELDLLRSQTLQELEVVRMGCRSELGQQGLTQHWLEKRCEELGDAIANGDERLIQAEARRVEDTKAMAMLSDKMSDVSDTLEASNNELSDRVSRWMQSIETRLEKGHRLEDDCARQLQALSSVLEEEQEVTLDLESILHKLEAEREQRIAGDTALRQSLQHLEVQAVQTSPQAPGSTSPGSGSPGDGACAGAGEGLALADSPGISNARWSAHTKAALEARLQDLAGAWRAELRSYHTELEASCFDSKVAEAQLGRDCSELGAELSALQTRVSEIEHYMR